MGVVQHRFHLLATDAGKPLEEFLNGGAAFQILEQRLYGNARVFEQPDTADFPGNPLHGRALGPVEHVGNVSGSAPKRKPGFKPGAAEAGEEAAGVGGIELVAPDAEDGPAAGAEGAGDEAVAGAVGGDLFPPEGGVGLGRGGVERAAVPEAAVDEDGEPARAEDEVGSDAEFLQLQTFTFPLERSSPPPAGDAVGAKDRDEPQLGGRIAARADGRHDGGAFSFREDVGHGQPPLPVDFAPVADREQMDHVLRGIEGVDDPVIADAQAKTAAAGHAVVGKGGQPAAHVVDFGLDPVTNRIGQFQEDIIKRRVVDLQGAAHTRL